MSNYFYDLGLTLDIGLDVDDVLFPWSERAHQAVVKAGRDNGAVITRWDCHQDYGITPDEFWEIVTAEYLDGMLLREPYLGVQDLILVLMANGHRVHLVTARGFEGDLAETVREETRKWLDLWAIPHDSLTFTKDKAALGLDYFLDDGCHNVVALREAGCEAYLRTQDHNLSSDLPRVADLSAFVETVLNENEVMCK